MGEPEQVRGQKVLIEFDGARCIHSRHCVLDRPDVFVPNTPGAWIHPDNATPEQVEGLAQNCPSGAIRYQRLDGGPGEAAPLVNVVRVRENGPLAFHAALAVAGHPSELRATLCRCGGSKNKPYCDGSHGRIGFVATGEPATRESTALAARSGTVEIKPQLDGPLLVTGNLEICAGTGRTVDRVTKVAFCRCGQSSNKPFCDGTHAKVGFRSE
jgi:CDGSH-type Zn-finger protein/uncharacterized Fe-S cluster protein YjdI